MRRTPPIIILLGVCTLIGFGYSMYQVITSFDRSEQTPEYERMPPAAFALPEAELLVDPQKLNAERLPDSDYEEIAAKAERVAASVAKRQVSAGALRRAGMEGRAAETNAGVLRAAARTLAGRQVSGPGQITLEPIGLRAATAIAALEVFSESLGATSITLTMGFVERDGEWKLQGVEVE